MHVGTIKGLAQPMVDRVFWAALGTAILAATDLAAQARPDAAAVDSVELTPAPRYRAGWLRRWLLGANYRDLWTQPVRVEQLDLARFAGGLTPECRAGGSQSALLDLRGADQRRYLFQSADVDPTGGLLPAPLRRTPAADLLRDQVSSRHPAGALVVAPLLEAAGVLHVEPRLRIMPDAADLGEFRQVFAGVLGTVEEQPVDGFAGSDLVEKTGQLWSRLDASPADRVDARAYLTARLVDLLVGDTDRHFDRWHWARYARGQAWVWRPIPRDRNQAFARLDGLVFSVARRYVPRLVSFGPTYPDMYGLTWSARALDRRFLVELDKVVWDSVARVVQGRVADRVLESAVERLPREMHQRHGAELLQALRSRRERLQDAADAFYPLVAEYADIHATEQDDWSQIDRLDQRQVRVRLATADRSDRPYFDRTFTLGETKEIRLYLAGGNDRVILRGSTARSPTVRVVGGSGRDVLVDSSIVGAPIVRSVLTRAYFYDSDGDSEFVSGPGTEIDRSTFRPTSRSEPYRPRSSGACDAGGQEVVPPRELGDPIRDWGSSWVPSPWLSYQPNVGLLIGAGAERRGYAFRKSPYGSRETLRGAFATGPGRFRVWYQGDFRKLPRGAWASLSFRYSGIDFLKFHGFGNETELTAPAEYYQATQRQVAAAASLTVFPPNSRISLGPFFGFAETELGGGNLVDSLRPYGSDGLVEVGLEARVDVDTRDRPSTPRRGVHLEATGRFVPKAFDVTGPYGSASAEAATYLSLGNPARVTLAMRVGGKRVWGRYPFHAAAYLGGAGTLRGYNEQRFAGDAVAYGNGEVRLFLLKTSVLLPGELGILGLGDIGRTYLVGERSERWHRAVGGGVWLALVERGGAVTVTVVRSPERWAYYVGLGFMY